MTQARPERPLTTVNNDLATLTGRPRRHSVGGKTFRLYPQTLGTLARLQEYLDAQTADPDDAAFGAIDGLPADAQRYVLGEGCWRLERRRAIFGTARGDDLLFSVGGLTELLYLSVRRGCRRFSRADAAALYWRLDDAGHRKLAWTIWGSRPKEDYGVGAGGDPEPVDWWGVFHRLTNEPYGWPPREVARLTWQQVICVLGKGDAPGSGIDVKRFPGGKEALQRRKQEDPWFP